MFESNINNFYGRKTIMELLKKRILDLKEGYRQNIAFLGERHIGKSMVLHKFAADLDDKEVIPVYVDVENKDLNQFYNNFVGSMLYGFSIYKKLPLFEDIKVLLESTHSCIPKTVRAIKKIQFYLEHGKKAEAYREIISIPEIFTKETNTFCVLMLDEFHCLEDFAIPGVFKELGKKIMTQKRSLYIVSSSLPLIAKKILSEKLSLLFGDFEVIQIQTFDLKTSQEFIKHHIKDSKISDQLCNFVIDFTGGHPLYMQLICNELVSLSALHKQKEIFIPLLTKAIENVLFNSWGVLSRHFDLMVGQLCSGKGNVSVPSILISLARGKQKLKDLVVTTGIKQSPLSLKINRFIEMEIVSKNGNFYYLKDKLLRYWIKYIFHTRRQNIGISQEGQRKQFEQDIPQAIESFNKVSSRNLSSRIVELLSCFEDESFYINGRRYRLPLFQEIIPTKVRGSAGEYFDTIKAISSSGEWVIVLNTTAICEQDIHSIIMAARKVSQKLKKCVLVSLSKLDDNARVKALQERMWIWNEGEINTLLDLYGKPYIVI